MNLYQRCETISTEQLKECAVGLFTSEEDSATVALEAVLSELEKRMPEQEFIDFCDSF